MFCNNCGNHVPDAANFCRHCGSQIQQVVPHVAPQAYPQQTFRVPEKSKGVAILLAVFFGLFSWLYTYKYDSWKFWLSLILALITVGLWGAIAWVWAIIDSIVRDDFLYKNYYRPF